MKKRLRWGRIKRNHGKRERKIDGPKHRSNGTTSKQNEKTKKGDIEEEDDLKLEAMKQKHENSYEDLKLEAMKATRKHD